MDVRGVDFSLFANKARDVYGLSLLGLGNELYHGIFPGPTWHHAAPDTGNIRGVQITGGFIGAVGVLLGYYPIGYYALICAKAHDVNGLQISMTGNTAEQVRGGQIGGLFNIVQDGLHGLQIAGLANGAKAGGFGIQVSALGNETEGDYAGVQISGCGNVGRGSYSGLRLAAIIGNESHGDMTGFGYGTIGNVSANLTGGQLGVIFNCAKGDADGVQVSVCNVATRSVRGLQVGVVNFCRQMSGVQIGGINIIWEGKLPVFFGMNANF